MIVPDANLLVYAYNLTSPFHVKSAAWWERCLSGREIVGLCPSVLFAFIRIVTSSRAFGARMSVDEASAHIASWLAEPVAQVLATEPADIFETIRLIQMAGTGGDLVSDAQIAAIALRRDGVVHTADSDFGRFPGVRWHNPLVTARGR